MKDLHGELIDGLRPHLATEDRDAEPFILDVGFSNVVVRFGGTVVRVARTAEAGSKHASEAAVLRALAGRLPIDIPGPIRLVTAGGEIRHGASIAPRLPGRPMRADDAQHHPMIVKQIAEALAALHSVPTSAFPQGALLDLDPIPEVERLVRETTPWLRERLSRAQRDALEGRWARSAEVLHERKRVVSHGDAWLGNMLVTSGRFSALLDWEDACIADPVLDLAAQLHLAGEAGPSVMTEYVRLLGPIDDLDERVEGYRLIREVAGMAYLLRNGIEEELADALAKIGAVLDGE
jgi:aminoglycoside phosphotransferase (APT) family kinase protein